MANSTAKKYKLNGEHKEFVINKLALHCGVTEIAEALKSEFGVDVTPQNIAFYKKNYETEWRKQREYFNLNIAEIEPFADKANRVLQRGELIRDLMKHLWLEDVKIKNNVILRDGDNKIELFKLKGNHDVINKLLDSIHKELEPDKLALTDPSGNLSLIDLIKKANEGNGEK